MTDIVLFLIGMVGGIALSILVVVVLIFLKNPIQQKLTIIEKQISNVGPRPKGFIIEPESESEEIRKQIIEKNRQLGRDTKLEELR